MTTTTTTRPPIYVTAEEHDRLLDLAYATLGHEPGAQTLIEELSRAKVAPLAAAPQDIVRMNDEVTFLYDGSTYRAFALVYPQEADISARRISVLTQVGAMLLGLSPGQSIAWTGSDGRAHQIAIEAVARP